LENSKIFVSTKSQIRVLLSIVHKINDDLENKRICTVAFIGFSQAFDKVLLTGLLYRLKHAFLHTAYALLKSYLTDRTFQVRQQKEYTPLYAIHSGVPQGISLVPSFIQSLQQM
jgi:hypothetical protein